MEKRNFVGIDIAKDKFDAAIKEADTYKTREFANTKSGFKKLLEWTCKTGEKPWFCMEATGVYGVALSDYLYKLNHEVSVINPLMIKRFSQSRLLRTKSDPLDAQTIAEYGSINEPRLYEPKKTVQKEMSDLVNILNSLKELLVKLKNQLSSLQGKASRKYLVGAIKRLEKEIAQAEKEIAEQLEKDKELVAQKELLLSITGVGLCTSYTLLSRVTNINHFGHAKQFAAHLGITPFERKSGKYVGKTTMSKIGDSKVRKVLYMAALVATRHNPIVKAFADRLKAKGKAPKAVLGAAMRKLAHIIYGVLKNQKPFDASVGYP